MAYRQQELTVHTWTFIRILANILRHAERNNHNSSIYAFGLCPFDVRKKLFKRRINILQNSLSYARSHPVACNRASHVIKRIFYIWLDITNSVIDICEY